MSDFNEIYRALQLKKKIPGELSSLLVQPEDEDRRTGIERRRFTYSQHVPDKRSGVDRRRILNLDVKEQT